MKKLITLVASLLAVALLTVPVFAAENQSLLHVTVPMDNKLPYSHSHAT